MTIAQLETELKQPINGLLMMSESDEPFEFFYDEQHTGNELNEETVRKLAGMPAQYPLEVVELDYFFRNMTAAAEPGEEAEARAARFRKLQNILQELLQDVKAYRIGETRITVYILGRTTQNEIAGLKTVVVET
jgi:hypothetical protein